ncbi:hypothetical protein FB451DRAFT_780658 [Mycena latifolia]|nr:hypothetical protein FB451DRAFT_780658 [Mycena latifolia]
MCASRGRVGFIERISPLPHAYATSRPTLPRDPHLRCLTKRKTSAQLLQTFGIVWMYTYSARVALPGDLVPGVLKPTSHLSLWDHRRAPVALGARTQIVGRCVSLLPFPRRRIELCLADAQCFVPCHSGSPVLSSPWGVRTPRRAVDAAPTGIL